jgi:hypothetical protein
LHAATQYLWSRDKAAVDDWLSQAPGSTAAVALFLGCGSATQTLQASGIHALQAKKKELLCYLQSMAPFVFNAADGVMRPVLDSCN